MTTQIKKTGLLYFIGIAGHAIRGLALAARELGYSVSGLDETGAPPGSDWLDDHKIIWARQFEPSQLDGVTAVIVNGAHATKDYPAIVEANKRKISVKSWAQLVGELTANEHVVSVAGTHGKTTTSALITWLLESSGRRPDFLIGIQPNNFDSSVRMAGSTVAVIEGDEYRASPLENKSKLQYYHPDVLVLTSVEHDHPDIYPDLQSVIDHFTQVVTDMPKSGRLIVCADSQTVLDIAKSASCPVETYGLKNADYTANNIGFEPAGIEFNLMLRGKTLGRLAVPLYGKHNVLNALAASAVALGEELSIEQIIAGAQTFKGCYRRFNLITPPEASVTIIDDYAHHPTEAATNIEAAKLHFPGRRVVVIYRPHTYSRTAALLPEYHSAFNRADLVYITDIEGAREAGLEHTVSGQDIVDGIKVPAHFASDRAKLIELVKSNAKPGDIILCFSVSGYDQLAEELARSLNP